MPLKIKHNGSYGNIVGVFRKDFGTYFPANGAYVKQGGAYVSQGYEWNKGPPIDYVMPLGSSSTLFTFSTIDYDADGNITSDNYQKTRASLCRRAVDLPVLTSSIGSADGATTTSLKNSIDGLLAGMNAPALSASGVKILFPICVGNNDIISRTNATNWQPLTYSERLAAFPDEVQTVINNVTYIVTKIAASGHYACLGTVNPRNGCFDQYKTWNDQLYRPLINSLISQGLMHPGFVTPEGNPVYDWEWVYWYYTQWAPDGIRIPASQWYASDGVHPAEISKQFLQEYIAAQFGRYAKSPRLINPTRSVLFSFHGVGYVSDHGGFNQTKPKFNSPVSGTGVPLQTVLYDRRGNIKVGASLSLTSPSASTVYHGGSNKTNFGALKIDLSNQYFQDCLTYSYAPMLLSYSEGPGAAGRVGKVKVTFSQNTTGNWESNYTVQGVTKWLRGSSPGVQIAEFDAVLDVNGSVDVTITAKSGAACISGAEFIFP